VIADVRPEADDMAEHVWAEAAREDEVGVQVFPVAAKPWKAGMFLGLKMFSYFIWVNTK
jgi:hypothetical protein